MVQECVSFGLPSLVVYEGKPKVEHRCASFWVRILKKGSPSLSGGSGLREAGNVVLKPELLMDMQKYARSSEAEGSSFRRVAHWKLITFSPNDHEKLSPCSGTYRRFLLFCLWSSHVKDLLINP